MLARQPQGSRRHDGHHRRPAARDGNLRGPQAQGPGGAGRDLRHGRAPLGQAPRQDDDHRPHPSRAWRSEHHVPQDKELQVHAGDYVEAGDPLIRGPLIPHDILRIKGEESLYQYLLTEVQNVYRSQGVKINDKHIEIILNQMLRKVKVEDAGDTKFLPGEVVDKFRFRAGNDAVGREPEGRRPGRHQLQGGRRRRSRPS